MVDLLGDVLAVDHHGDGLAAQMALLVIAEVLHTLRNDQRADVGAGLVVRLDALHFLERAHGLVRDARQQVEVAALHIMSRAAVVEATTSRRAS